MHDRESSRGFAELHSQCYQDVGRAAVLAMLCNKDSLHGASESEIPFVCFIGARVCI